MPDVPTPLGLALKARAAHIPATLAARAGIEVGEAELLQGLAASLVDRLSRAARG